MLCRMFTAMLMLSLVLASHAQNISQPTAQIALTVRGSTNSAKLDIDTTRRENWSTIDLHHSGLAVDAGTEFLLNKTELGGCTRELVRLEWRPNDPIDLYLIHPQSATAPPVVLFLLDHTFDTDIFRSRSWCQEARQHGIAIAGFGSALSPQRFHAPRPMKQWFVSELQEALASSTHDVQMILNYLARRSDIDMQHVGMLGQGSGGTIAILAAAADSRISALDLLDPWGDWPDWLKDSKLIPEQERATYLQPAFIARVVGLDPIQYLPKLQCKALRIQLVTEDPVTPPSARDKIATAVPSTGSILRFADRHSEHDAWGTKGISEWISEQLRSEQVSKIRTVD
jgi:dienelactone hydrolase